MGVPHHNPKGYYGEKMLEKSELPVVKSKKAKKKSLRKAKRK